MTQNKSEWLAEKALVQAQHYYTTAYQRWALELSHDKNTTIAKDIAVFIVSELYVQTDDDFWLHVKRTIFESTHNLLYKP
jgi:hypothetical protein